MRSLLNEYSFVVILLFTVAVFCGLSLRLGGLWRVMVLSSGCLIVAVAIFLMVWNRSSSNILYASKSNQSYDEALRAPAVIQFYSNY